MIFMHCRTGCAPTRDKSQMRCTHCGRGYASTMWQKFYVLCPTKTGSRRYIFLIPVNMQLIGRIRIQGHTVHTSHRSSCHEPRSSSRAPSNGLCSRQRQDICSRSGVLLVRGNKLCAAVALHEVQLGSQERLQASKHGDGL
jgi:hypothetical protein